MISYPLTFSVSSKTASGIQTPWTSESPFEPVPVAIPAEFAGPGGGFSPEDFYALALLNCFIATFKVIAEKSQLTFSTIEASGLLTVDRDEKGSPWMKKMDIHVTLNAPSDKGKAERLLEKTKNSCLILNSVKTEKTFHFTVA